MVGMGRRLASFEGERENFRKPRSPRMFLAEFESDEITCTTFSAKNLQRSADRIIMQHGKAG